MNITKADIMAILKEDQAFSDVTTNSIIIQNKLQNFRVISKNLEPFILCGIDSFVQAFESVMANYSLDICRKDGSVVEYGESIIAGKASVKELLQVERSCLNLIQHLSAIATKTNLFVKTLGNENIKILDTRKTVPLVRKLQKYAVVTGGGFNHRMNLAQMVMIKDNHIMAAGSISEAVRLVKKNQPSMQVEVECENIEQVKEAVNAKIDIIMLDNMSIADISIASAFIRKHSTIKIEVSGGINLGNIASYCEVDVDYISIGNLTHSVNAVDISMDFLS